MNESRQRAAPANFVGKFPFFIFQAKIFQPAPSRMFSVLVSVFAAAADSKLSEHARRNQRRVPPH
jgi:hypothetical protein